MNFRLTTLLFALLLSTLWVFGLMVQYKGKTADPSFLSPTFSSEDAGKIKRVTIEKKEGDKEGAKTFVFEEDAGNWYHVENKQRAKIEAYRIKTNIIESLKKAKNDDTEKIDKGLKGHGLQSPEMVIKIEGELKGAPHTWEFKVGSQTKDKSLAFVTASDRPDKIFAVPTSSIEGARIKDPRYMRSKQPLSAVNDGNLVGIHVKKAAEKLELKKEDELWHIVESILGPLGPAGPVDTIDFDEKKKDVVKDSSGITSVRALLTAIAKIQVEDDEDFEQLGKKSLDDYGLGKEKESLRIDILSGGDKDKKDAGTATLLVGNKVPDGELRGRKGTFYYARMGGEDAGVMQLDAKVLEAIEKVLKEPGKIRSHDIAAFDAKNVDYIVLKQGSDEYKFYRTEGKAAADPHDFMKKFQPQTPTEWHLYINKEKQKADARAVQNLIEQMLGRQAIAEFAKEDDKKKFETELASPGIEVSVYTNAVEKKKEDEKDKEKKKEEGKPEAKPDDKTKNEPPKLNEKIKPVVTLTLAKVDKDKDKDKEFVTAKRTLLDSKDKKIDSLFTVKKDFADKVLPAEGVLLAYSDRNMPPFPKDEEVVEIKLKRTTDRGVEEFVFMRSLALGRMPHWYVKDGDRYKLVNSENVNQLEDIISRVEAKKLLKKIEDKEDLTKYGLAKPGVTITVTTIKTTLPPFGVASFMAMLASPGTGGLDGIPMFANTLSGPLDVARRLEEERKDADKTITLELGDDTTEEKDKPGTFAKHSGSKMLFLVHAGTSGSIKKMDLRERTYAMQYQPQMELLYRINTAFNPHGVLMFAAPHNSQFVHNLDADKIKEIQFTVRTPAETRSFHFVRNPKDKDKEKDKPWTWTDKTTPTLHDFKIDNEKVNEFVKEVAKLKSERIVNFALSAKDAKNPKAPDPLAEYKLNPEDATIKLDLVTEDRGTVTLTVGMNPESRGFGSHYARTSLWGEVVFLLSPGRTIQQLLNSPSTFAKERFTGN